MSRSAIRRLAFLAVVLVLLTPWSAQALPLDRPLSAPLAELASGLTGWLTSLWGDIGCSWDPGGGCRTTTSDQPDIGCSMDPDGQCRDELEVGCSLDPGGRCGERLEIGCSADPDGGTCASRQ